MNFYEHLRSNENYGDYVHHRVLLILIFQINVFSFWVGDQQLKYFRMDNHTPSGLVEDITRGIWNENSALQFDKIGTGKFIVVS